MSLKFLCDGCNRVIQGEKFRLTLTNKREEWTAYLPEMEVDLCGLCAQAIRELMRMHKDKPVRGL